MENIIVVCYNRQMLSGNINLSISIMEIGMQIIIVGCGKVGSTIAEQLSAEGHDIVIVDCDDPRVHGKPLKGKLAGIWRYRVGDYRIFADIHDEILTIEIFEMGHRREVYK